MKTEMKPEFLLDTLNNVVHARRACRWLRPMQRSERTEGEVVKVTTTEGHIECRCTKGNGAS